MSVSVPQDQASHSRHQDVVLVVCLLLLFLLAASGFGFWQWIKISETLPQFGTQGFYSILFLCVVPLVIVFFIALVMTQRFEHYRLSVSYHARIDFLQKRLNAQEDFLRVISDHDPESIAIFDQDNRFWFVNASLAQVLQRDVKDIIGQPLDKVLNYDRSRIAEVRLKSVTATGKALETLDQRVDADGTVQFIQSRFERIQPFGEFRGGVIVRSENVTNLLVERERRENMLRQVISALVSVIDRRDPYAAGHSARVGKLSRAIAEEMVLSESEIETAEIAGSLMNFGKVLVSRGILTKTTTLTPEELQHVRHSILTSADILAIIDFPTSVVPTLRQVLERYDGSGIPEGLKGEAILITARIVAVANTFVALVSPRAHRAGIDFNEALRLIKADANVTFDQRVVAAMMSYIQSHQNKLEWLKPQSRR